MSDSNPSQNDATVNRPYDTEKTRISVNEIIKGQLIKVLFFLQSVAFVLILYRWNRDAPENEAKSAVLATSMTTIEVLLAILAIILGGGAFFGFWMIRREAITAAEDAAVREVRRLEEEGYLRKNGKSKSKKRASKPTRRKAPDLASTTEEDSLT